MRALVVFTLVSLAGCQCSPGGSPTVRIIAPANGSFLEGPGPHAATGEALDPDEVLQPERVLWKSDRDGTVGTSAITTVTLTPGEHRLSLEATDRDGNLGSAQVTVFVRSVGELDGGLTDAGLLTDAGTDAGVLADGGTVSDAGLFDGGSTDAGPIETHPVATIQAPSNAALFDEGLPIEFIGSASDAEDGMLTGASLVWTSDRAGVIGSGARVTLTNAALGAHRIVLTATDRSGRTGLASITVTVVRAGMNRPPVVTITSPDAGAQLTLGTATSLQGSASDPEDGALTGAALAWASSRDGALGTGVSLTPTLTLGVHTLTLTATDTMGAIASASVTVSVNQPNNQPPTATITQPATMQTVFQGTAVTFTGTGTDAEDGTLTGTALSWSSSLDGALGTGLSFTTSSLSVGDHTITLVARDSGGNTGTASIIVRVLPQNQAPTVNITGPMSGHSVTAGTAISFSGTASDPEDGQLTGAAVRWSSSLDGALGTGLSFTTSSLSVGSHSITFTATDSGGRSSSAAITITVMMSAMNVPPLARLTGPTAGVTNDALAFDGSTSTDSDGTVVSFRFDFGDGSPPITSSMPSATHGYSNAGTYTVTLTVTDDDGATASTTISITITAWVRVPGVVSPVGDDVGTACALATPGARVFLAWTGSRHPAVYFGERVNGVLQAEVVDGLGFNTGGLITQHVAMQLEANGTPHLVYVRDNDIIYATKVGGLWTRERVDTSLVHAGSLLSTSTREATAPSIALDGSTPSILYVTGAGNVPNPFRPAVATRTGPNTWSSARVSGVNSGSGTVVSVYPWSELVIDSARRHLFVVSDGTVSSNIAAQLVAWTPTTRDSVVLMPQALVGRQSLALSGTSRMSVLGGDGLRDVQLASTFSSTTIQRSLVEVFGTSQHVVASDHSGLPRLVVNHGSTLEVVRPAGSPGFWEWTELGPADPGVIDVDVDGANQTRACFVRAGKLMLY